ncbi:citramalate synthase [Gorillibacterium sp. sgz500922]|uniref:citramalate synthase n=1 Tax=Gorillibacterium sp. sgz500922 TaxID=3446694 RepID=UPI003F681311
MAGIISVFDTTLRDGTQGEGISLSAEDKIKIAQKLDALGVRYIEGGNPGSNGKDMEFFKRAGRLGLNARLTAFGSTRRKDSSAEKDASLLSILEAKVPTASLVGKSWDFHVHTALQTTLEENLAMIADSIRFLKRAGMEVSFDAEHFFDGFKHNRDYALSVLRTAAEAGADWLVLCDTNGGTMPGEVQQIVSAAAELSVPIGIHTHNDCELAVANALSAVQAGARMVQGTINGYGERCGNANLCSVLPNLQLKLGFACLPEGNLKHLAATARYVSEIANAHMPLNQPYVGGSAFAHKGGIHVSAILKDSKTYEHVEPESVGNKRRVLVSELAGQSNVLFKAQELGLNLDLENAGTQATIARIKELEHQGYQFEGADASLELLLRQASGEVTEVFSIESFKLLVEKVGDHSIASEAIVKVRVDGETVYTAAEGNGPVNALDNALRKALMKSYPALRDMHLSDYKVRVINEKDATAAKVRVLVESSDLSHSWSTVGVSENVIEASWQALLDSIRFALIGQQPVPGKSEDSQERVGIVNL